MRPSLPECVRLRPQHVCNVRIELICAFDERVQILVLRSLTVGLTPLPGSLDVLLREHIARTT